MQSRGFEANSSDEGIKVVDNALIEPVELGSSLAFELCVCFDGAEKACRERRVPVQRIGHIVSHALVGGLHHRYVRI